MVTATAGLPRTRLLSSDDAAQLDARMIGGKAAGLVRLAELGARVPPWVVLGVPTLRNQLSAARLDVEVDRLLADLGVGKPRTAHVSSASVALRAIVAALTLDEVREALSEVRATLGDGDFAVRSSAVGEDGSAHSFAGQFDSVLNVGAHALVDAVRSCWSSAFSERALDYRLRSGTLSQALDLAVIVQRMIVGDASGVLFTTDPLTGDERRVRISACRGTGERLVSGAADADELVADRDGIIVESRLVGATPAIDAAAVQSLVRAAVMIAMAEGEARDIEWTTVGGEIWLLQSRPVVAREPVHASPGIVWDNSNIQESYCGVTTPLTFSFARAAYAAVYTQTMRAVGTRETTIAQHRDVLEGLLGLIHGRVYYNLNNWYRGLLLLPAFRRNKADMERMMGVEEPVDFVADERPSRIERLRRVPQLMTTALGLGRRFLTIERDAREFLAQFDAMETSIDRSTIHNRSLGELADLLRVLRRVIDNWTTPIVNDFRVMMTTGRLRRIVERAMGDEADQTLQILLGGADVAVSSGPAMLMLRMADVAKRSPFIRAALSAGLTHAAEESAEFDALLRELVDKYGDRCMGELKLESRSLREDRAFIESMLANYLRADGQDAETTAREARERRLKTEALVASRVSLLARPRFRRALRSARASIRAREAMRLARSRLFGIHRQVYRAIGERLYERSRLGNPSDIFYLTVEEIALVIPSEARNLLFSTDITALVQSRRAVFSHFADLPAPNRVVTVTVPDPFAPTLHFASAPTSHLGDSRILRGLGCSPGVAEGPVRIISGPDDDLTIDGHVLVATRTDPGWSPLFHTAAAVVVERGSVLSHSAVLARELGLPAVVGIPGLVSGLRDGERVRVDGSNGTVERLEHT